MFATAEKQGSIPTSAQEEKGVSAQQQHQQRLQNQEPDKNSSNNKGETVVDKRRAFVERPRRASADDTERAILSPTANVRLTLDIPPHHHAGSMQIQRSLSSDSATTAKSSASSSASATFFPQPTSKQQQHQGLGGGSAHRADDININNNSNNTSILNKNSAKGTAAGISSTTGMASSSRQSVDMMTQQHKGDVGPAAAATSPRNLVFAASVAPPQGASSSSSSSSLLQQKQNEFNNNNRGAAAADTATSHKSEKLTVDISSTPKDFSDFHQYYFEEPVQKEKNARGTMPTTTTTAGGKSAAGRLMASGGGIMCSSAPSIAPSLIWGSNEATTATAPPQQKIAAMYGDKTPSTSTSTTTASTGGPLSSSTSSARQFQPAPATTSAAAAAHYQHHAHFPCHSNSFSQVQSLSATSTPAGGGGGGSSTNTPVPSPYLFSQHSMNGPTTSRTSTFTPVTPPAPQALMAGMLLVLSRRPFVRKWKPRWCVLIDRKNFLIFRTKQAWVSGARARKCINLTDSTLSQAIGRDDEPFTFGIFYASRFHRDHILRAASEEQMYQWLDALHLALGVQRDNVSLTDFEMLVLVGKGAYGRVIQARHKKSGLIYALKILEKKHTANPDQERSAVTERMVLEHVNHPFIVRLHFAFQTTDKLCFVLDFINGGDVYTLLKRRGALDENWVRFYGAQIVLALEYLHGMGIIYRDLKPENILINHDGYVKLTDFGLSRNCTPGERTYSIVGSPFYIAPEILSQDGYDRSVDWWSFGVLIFELLYGAPPHYEEEHHIGYKKLLTLPLNFPSTATKKAKDFLERLIVVDRTKRLGFSTSSFEQTAYIAHNVRRHPFFEGVSFDSVLAKEIKAPYVPNIKGPTDLSQFDRPLSFELQAVFDVLPCTPKHFCGFDYVRETTAKVIGLNVSTPTPTTCSGGPNHVTIDTSSTAAQFAPLPNTTAAYTPRTQTPLSATSTGSFSSAASSSNNSFAAAAGGGGNGSVSSNKLQQQQAQFGHSPSTMYAQQRSPMFGPVPTTGSSIGGTAALSVDVGGGGGGGSVAAGTSSSASTPSTQVGGFGMWLRKSPQPRSSVEEAEREKTSDKEKSSTGSKVASLFRRSPAPIQSQQNPSQQQPAPQKSPIANSSGIALTPTKSPATIAASSPSLSPYPSAVRAASCGVGPTTEIPGGKGWIKSTVVTPILASMATPPSGPVAAVVNPSSNKLVPAESPKLATISSPYRAPVPPVPTAASSTKTGIEEEVDVDVDEEGDDDDDDDRPMSPLQLQPLYHANSNHSIILSESSLASIPEQSVKLEATPPVLHEAKQRAQESLRFEVAPLQQYSTSSFLSNAASCLPPVPQAPPPSPQLSTAPSPVHPPSSLGQNADDPFKDWDDLKAVEPEVVQLQTQPSPLLGPLPEISPLLHVLPLEQLGTERHPPLSGGSDSGEDPLRPLPPPVQQRKKHHHKHHHRHHHHHHRSGDNHNAQEGEVSSSSPSSSDVDDNQQQLQRTKPSDDIASRSSTQNSIKVASSSSSSTSSTPSPRKPQQQQQQQVPLHSTLTEDRRKEQGGAAASAATIENTSFQNRRPNAAPSAVNVQNAFVPFVAEKRPFVVPPPPADLPPPPPPSSTEGLDILPPPDMPRTASDDPANTFATLSRTSSTASPAPLSRQRSELASLPWMEAADFFVQSPTSAAGIAACMRLLDQCEWDLDRVVQGLIAAILNREEVFKVLSPEIGERWRDHPDVLLLKQAAQEQIALVLDAIEHNRI